MGKHGSTGTFPGRFFVLVFILSLPFWLLGAQSVRRGWYLDQNLQGGYPGGVQSGTQLYYRIPLSERSGILWKPTKIDLGLSNELAPAFDFFGAFVDIEPIAFFDLALSAQAQDYFKALGYGFHDMAGYQSAFDSSTLDGLSSKNTSGCLLSASPTLKLALGPVVAADTLNIYYFLVDGGEGYFYEAVANCILAKNGVELSNQAYLLFTLGPGLMLGVNDSLLHVPASGYESQAIHAMGVFDSKLDEKISLYSAVMVGLYVEDRYYDHEIHAAGTIGLTLAL